MLNSLNGPRPHSLDESALTVAMLCSSLSTADLLCGGRSAAQRYIVEAVEAADSGELGLPPDF